MLVASEWCNLHKFIKLRQFKNANQTLQTICLTVCVCIWMVAVYFHWCILHTIFLGEPVVAIFRIASCRHEWNLQSLPTTWIRMNAFADSIGENALGRPCVTLFEKAYIQYNVTFWAEFYYYKSMANGYIEVSELAMCACVCVFCAHFLRCVQNLNWPECAHDLSVGHCSGAFR